MRIKDEAPEAEFKQNVIDYIYFNYVYLCFASDALSSLNSRCSDTNN